MCVLGTSVCLCVCHTRNAGSRRSAEESECVVLGRSVCLCVCVSYEECRVAVGLLERASVSCWAGPSVCVRVSYEECRVAVGLLERERECVCVRVCVCVSVCASYEECCVVVSLLERVSVWCWAGPSVYVRVIRGTPSSCRSARE